jgi:molecular chaperone IbpA
MRTTTFDFSPLFRSSIGFDRIFDLLENASQITTADGWPPYDILKTDDDEYRIAMAVAGFAREEVEVTHEPNLLVVRAAKPEDDGVGRQYLHRGIAGRGFERRFELADHVHVVAATLENGMLTIALRQEIPEEQKPRTIPIASGGAAPRLASEAGPRKKAA